MRAATVLADSGDVEAAISDFSVIGNDGSVPAAVRDICPHSCRLSLVDNGSYDDVAAQVESLSGPDNPMRHSAREALGLAAWKAGELTRPATGSIRSSATPVCRPASPSAPDDA